MRSRNAHSVRGFGSVVPISGTSPITRPYLTRALQAVEGRLNSMYSRPLPDDDERVEIIMAVSDPQSRVWSEIMQIHYLESAREGLRTALQAIQPGRGRPQ